MPAKKVAKKAPVAIITGVTGQDGSYLAELLLEKGYVVHGIKRRASSFNQQRIEHLFNDPALKDQFFIHYGDLMDVSDIIRLLNKVRPDEVYNLAAQSHVAVREWANAVQCRAYEFSRHNSEVFVSPSHPPTAPPPR